jgi:DNA-binding response OmpR family regulator
MSIKSKILIVEDDQRLAKLLLQELSFEGHEIITVHTGTDALLQAEDGKFDLIVLDLNLPDIDGIEVAERLQNRAHASILMLTARADVESKIKGLYAGASDYMTKPFSLQELVARIHVRLREQKKTETSLVYKQVELDLERKLCRAAEQTLTLTLQEFKLMELLLKNRGRIYSKDDLENRLYEADKLPGSNTVEVFVSSLRRKLSGAGVDGLIQTVRGMGYVIQ